MIWGECYSTLVAIQKGICSDSEKRNSAWNKRIRPKRKPENYIKWHNKLLRIVLTNISPMFKIPSCTNVFRFGVSLFLVLGAVVVPVFSRVNHKLCCLKYKCYNAKAMHVKRIFTQEVRIYHIWASRVVSSYTVTWGCLD